MLTLGFPEPYWSAQWAALYLGDVRACLQRLPARSVHCCVTSPPYWGLRDYGTGTWEGGSAECDHIESREWVNSKNTLGHGASSPNRYSLPPSNASNKMHKHQYHNTCGKCGASRTDMQIGAEPSPDCGTGGQAQCGGCFVCSIVGVFREVRRVLRDDGTVWLNLGDTYSGGKTGRSDDGSGDLTSRLGPKRDGCPSNSGMGPIKQRPPTKGISSGNLVGVPWRVALALQADGWVLRSDVPWVKRSAMPESADSRPCKSLEYVFLLAKNDSYYFDMDAVRPRAVGVRGGSCFGRVLDEDAAAEAGGHSRRYERPEYSDRAMRNSDLWFASIATPHGAVGVGDELVGLDVTTRGYKGAHFAVFPPAMITPLILASTSEHGCCTSCGRSWERVSVRVTESVIPPSTGDRAAFDAAGLGDVGRSVPGCNTGLRNGYEEKSSRTSGWRQSCGCRTDEVVPAIVLDPFVGSGTTVATAIQLGRAGVGIDLSEVYLQENAVPRIEAAIAEGRAKRGATVAVPAVVPPAARRLR